MVEKKQLANPFLKKIWNARDIQTYAGWGKSKAYETIRRLNLKRRGNGPRGKGTVYADEFLLDYGGITWEEARESWAISQKERKEEEP